MTDTKPENTKPENTTKYLTRDEVFDFLAPRVEQFPFKAEIVKEGVDKIAIRQVLYDAKLRPNGKVDLFDLTFTEDEPIYGYCAIRDIYFGGETPRAVWRTICRLIGKPQLYDI